MTRLTLAPAEEMQAEPVRRSWISAEMREACAAGFMVGFAIPLGLLFGDLVKGWLS